MERIRCICSLVQYIPSASFEVQHHAVHCLCSIPRPLKVVCHCHCLCIVFCALLCIELQVHHQITVHSMCNRDERIPGPLMKIGHCHCHCLCLCLYFALHSSAFHCTMCSLYSHIPGPVIKMPCSNHRAISDCPVVDTGV